MEPPTESPDHPTRMLLAEQLVGESRQRRLRRMSRRERAVNLTSASAFLLTAAALAATIPSERPSHVALVAGLVVAYALVSCVRFEFGGLYVAPEQLLFVPLVLLCPLPLVPLLVAVAAGLSMLPDVLDGSWHRDRWVA